MLKIPINSNCLILIFHLSLGIILVFSLPWYFTPDLAISDSYLYGFSNKVFCYQLYFFLFFLLSYLVIQTLGGRVLPRDVFTLNQHKHGRCSLRYL